ncbi:hypothetical protein EON65_41810 [archaeon]|nr:MAG: hypothetical protein EON65_41810 [archaeon]
MLSLPFLVVLFSNYYCLGAIISEINDHSHPNPKVTILIPFVFSERELELCTDFVDRVWGELWKVQEFRIEGDPYMLGLTLDVPRAFLIADKLVANKRISTVSMSGAELTELVFGMDRGDAESFMVQHYFDIIVLSSWKAFHVCV